MTTLAPWPQDTTGLLSQGTVIKEQYELTGYLGGGGFGHVYLANHRLMQREVAIKVLSATHDQTIQERFLREAQASAMIDHPNVLTVHDFGFYGDDRRPFIVMELLKGHDLEDELKNKGPLEEKRALELLMPTLEALQEAHKHNIVHKDLKPSNLFLIHPGTDREQLKIIDFGVACFSQPIAPEPTEAEILPSTSSNGPGSARLTTVGQSTGTPHYMAPEYLETLTATPAVDVYQMGLIFVELLTGTQVVSGKGPYACLVKHLQGQLDIPDNLRAGPLGPIIARSTARQPEGRYQNAEELRQALAKRYQDRYAPKKIEGHVPTRLDAVVEYFLFLAACVLLLLATGMTLDGPVDSGTWFAGSSCMLMMAFFGASFSLFFFLGGKISSLMWFWTRPIISATILAVSVGLTTMLIGQLVGKAGANSGSNTKEASTPVLEEQQTELEGQLARTRAELFDLSLEQFQARQKKGKKKPKAPFEVTLDKDAVKLLAQYQGRQKKLARITRELERRSKQFSVGRGIVLSAIILGLFLGVLSWWLKRRKIRAARPGAW